MTEHIKRKLQEEMNQLEHELVHDLPKEIKKAAALGDLSENAEYHMAKQRQEFVKARLRQLGKRMGDLALINMDNIPRDKVGLGSTVRIYDNDKNEEVEYKLVTSEEADVRFRKDFYQLTDWTRAPEQESWRHRHRGHTQRQTRNGDPALEHDSRRSCCGMTGSR